MDALIPLKGLAVGLALAIPVGPIGLLVFRRAATHGAKAGVVTGLGAALADALLCAVAAFGLTTISEFIKQHMVLLNHFGGFALLVIGYAVFRTAPPKEITHKPKRPGSLGAFSMALLLTISNPMTILGVAGIFAGFGLAHSLTSWAEATLLVGSIFAGSMLWWLILSRLASLLRDKASGYWMRRINQGCGIAIGLIGVVQLARLLLGLV